MRKICAVALILTGALLFFRAEPIKSVCRFFKIGPTATHLASLQMLAHSQEWQKFGKEAKEAIRAGEITFSHLREVAPSGSPVQYALQSTNAILALQEPTGLKGHTLFPIALFIETDLQNELKNGTTYWPENRFEREIQCDVKRNRVFIHLGIHGVSRLGKGRKKMVTKTILYDRENPEMMARGFSESKMDEEMSAMEHLQGKLGLLEAEGLCSHRDSKTKKKVMTIITKIYRPGCLHDVLYNPKTKFTLKEKIGIATDLVTGIASMHGSGYVHRDLGARNYFISIDGEKLGNRAIRAVVADMGRTRLASTVSHKPVQGNSTYLSPEGYDRAHMKEDSYYHSDLFAVGCVLWHLYYGEPPEWRKHKFCDKSSPDMLEQQTRCREAIVAARLQARERVEKNPIAAQFILLILQMTDPDPRERGSAEEAKKNFQQLLQKVASRDIIDSPVT